MSSSRSVISSDPSSTGDSSSDGAKRRLDPPPSFILEAQQSLLYFRVVDAESPDPVLNDIYAKQIINKINLAVLDTMAQDLRMVKFWCIRAKRIDEWCLEFMKANPSCAVVNVNCGLDTRYQRLQPPSSVRWIEFDHPTIVDFRRSVFPRPNGDYQLVAADTSQPNYLWLETIPDDRPTMVIGESNMFYMRPDVAKGIIHQVAEHFTTGQFVFDVLGTLAARLTNMKVTTVQKKTGMKITWALDNPRTLPSIHPKIRLLDEFRYSNDMPPWFGEFKTKLLQMLPAYRNLGRIILLGFDPPSAAADESDRTGSAQRFEPLPTLEQMQQNRPSTSYTAWSSSTPSTQYDPS